MFACLYSFLNIYDIYRIFRFLNSLVKTPSPTLIRYPGNFQAILLLKAHHHHSIYLAFKSNISLKLIKKEEVVFLKVGRVIPHCTLCRSSHSHCRCSSKYVFLKISQYSQENTCVGVSLFRHKACIFIKKRLQHRCFCINFAKFLRAAVFRKHLWWLRLLDNSEFNS